MNSFAEEFALGDRLGAFLAWWDRWEQRHVDRLQFPLSVDDFISEVQRTNFSDVDSMDLLLGTMERKNTPFIYLGKSTFGGSTKGYGISPSAFRLWPNINSSYKKPRVLDTNILAINLGVPVDRQGVLGHHMFRHSTGEVAMRTTTMVDLENFAGFVFAQLGHLRVFGGDSEALQQTEKDEMGEDWFDTDFVAVVKVSRYGQPQSVWVMYNFFEDTGDQYAPNDSMRHIRTTSANGQRLPHIGRLYEGCDRTFTVAKIADSLEDLRYPRDLFNFNVKYTTERQLVKARLFAGSARRIMIGPRFVPCHSEIDNPSTSRSTRD